MMLEQVFMNSKVKFILLLLMMNIITISSLITIYSANANAMEKNKLVEIESEEPLKAKYISNINPEDIYALNRQVVQQEIDRTTAYSMRELSPAEISAYTDISNMRTITVDQLNYIIDYWVGLSGIESPFVGQGQIFINASKESGLDPVYILAHAGVESAWGTSEIAIDKNNYFGIGSFDHNPYNSSYSFKSLYSGIVDGARWIKNNYYQNGQTSLYTMRYNNGINQYCTSEMWVDMITEIIVTSYSLI